MWVRVMGARMWVGDMRGLDVGRRQEAGMWVGDMGV